MIENEPFKKKAMNARATEDELSIANMSEIRSFTKPELLSLKLIHSSEEGSIHLKVFRDLRTQLMKQSNWNKFTCLVVPIVSGGGSYVAANLAATIALDKSKTALLVDANLYSPYAQSLLPVPSQMGLTDFLGDESMGVEDVVYASGIPRMRIIPAGTNIDGGTEKIHSHRMEELFREIQNKYSDRYIIVDSPASAEYDADVSILSELCDFVVLVVPYGKVAEPQLLSAIERVGKDKLAGIVYNQC